MRTIIGASGVSNVATDALIMLFFVLGCLAVVALAVWLITKYVNKPSYQLEYKKRLEQYESLENKQGKQKPLAINFRVLLILVLAVALIIRLLFTFLIKGHRGDFDELYSLCTTLNTQGIGGYYTQNATDFFYPLVVYIYSIIATFIDLFNLTTSSLSLQFFLKLPLIIADILTALLLYKAAKKYINEYVALIFAAFVALFPPFIMASSVWGSVYSLFGLFACLTFFFIANKNYLLTFASFSLCLLCSKDALYLFLLVAVFVVFAIVKASIYIKKSKISSFKEIMLDKEANKVVYIPIYIIGFFFAIYLIALPLTIKALGANLFSVTNLLFLKPLSSFNFFGHNATSIFNLFLKNGAILGSDFPTVVFSVIFGVLILAVVLLIYLSRKNRANLSFLGAYILLTLNIYFIGFSEMNLVAVFAIMLLSLLLIRDKRILQILTLLSLVFIVNTTAVMINAGYLNNLEDTSFSLATYIGSDLLDKGTGLVVSIICSVVAIFTHIYTTFVLLDISMSNKRVYFSDAANPTFLSSIKSFIRNK